MTKGKKYATITIRTTEEEKNQLQQLADKERRPLANMLYVWIIDKLEKEAPNNDK